jgi:hypothetical protein
MGCPSRSAAQHGLLLTHSGRWPRHQLATLSSIAEEHDAGAGRSGVGRDHGAAGHKRPLTTQPRRAPTPRGVCSSAGSGRHALSQITWDEARRASDVRCRCVRIAKHLGTLRQARLRSGVQG